MASSCERFCNIQELVDILTTYLDLKDLSRSARTCRALYRNSSPSLYRNMENLDHVSRVFSSISALHALARNVRRINTLSLGVDELVYYYHCVCAFEEIHSRTTVTFGAQTSWLRPPYSCRFIALPPITRLSHLTVGLLGSKDRAYTMASVNSPRATFAQLSWLIAQNPGLTSLDMEGVIIKGLRSGRLLIGAIAGLAKLECLRFRFSCTREDWLELCSLLFSACQPSIKRLALRIWCGEERDQNDNGENNGENEAAAAAAAAAVPKRQGPLVNLEELSFDGMYAQAEEWVADLMPMFKQCPNIKRLEVLHLFSDFDTAANLGASVGKECSKIESLKFETSPQSNSFAFNILDSLPGQQLQHFDSDGAPDFSNTMAELAIQRHSTSLREIRINGADCFYKISISVILKECVNLEVLYIPFSESKGCCLIPLSDALDHPWGCKRLTHLTLTVAVYELSAVEPEVQPYYLRPTPITLSVAELQHLSQLRWFYRQLGGLTALQELDLTMAPQEDDYYFGQELGKPMSFPAMLNLKDASTGRPGFLRHLAGLNKLESLRGSFYVNASETKVTVGWKEARWMDKHWPQLREAWFFERADDVTAPFIWLQERRKDRHVDLWTNR